MGRAAWLGLVVAAAALTTAAVASWLTEPPPRPAPPAPALDTDGDPLPPWAVCRVGSARFRGAEAMIAFTADGTQIVHGTTDGSIRVIDRRTGAVVREFAAQRGDAGRGPPRSLMHALERAVRPRTWRDRLCAAALSPDGTRVATVGVRTTNIYDLATGKCLTTWRDDGPWPMTWSSDGARIVTADYEAGVTVRELAGGRVVLRARDKSPVSRSYTGQAGLSVSPTGAFAAVQTCKLRVVDLATGAEVFATEPDEFAGPVAFSPDGAFLLHMRKNEAVVVRDTRTWAAVREFAGNAFALAWSPDGASVAVAGERLRLIDVATGATRTEFPVRASRVTFSPDGSTLAALAGVTVRVFDVARGVEDPPAPPPLMTAQQITWSPDGRSLALCDDSFVRIADPATGRVVSSRDTGGQSLDLSAFAIDGRHVAVTGGFGRGTTPWVAVVDVASADDAPRVRRFGNGWTYWDHRERALRICGQSETEIRICDPTDGRVVLERKEFPSRVAREVDVIEGLVVVRGGTDREFDIHELATGKLLAEINAPAALVDVDGCDLAQGRLLLSDEDQGCIAAFDARTGERQVLIEAHVALTGWPVLPRDGAFVASFDADNAVRVFDGSDGRELAILRGHRGRPQGLAFSPDGRRLATASQDGTVLVWDVAAATGR